MSINFTLNGAQHIVDPAQYPADITLNTYIRNNAQLSGTKFMCLEGGCGVCIVSVRGPHPITGIYRTWSSNSCLTLLNVCDGWEITTIEGLGNKNVGYHPLQERLANLNGSQCGYCSPGMIMNMYSLLKANNGKVLTEQVENSFGGNLCRCTGYRPILDAMKSFSTDSEYCYLDLCTDIEDLWKECPNKRKGCKKIKGTNKSTVTGQDGRHWFFPENLHELFDVFENIRTGQHKLVGGSTGHGVYRSNFTTDFFIDINKIPDLHSNVLTKDYLELGANISLTEMMDVLEQTSHHEGFQYCKSLVAHIDKVAHIAVRNMGTLAGNLSLKHQYNEFPSDLFVILSAVGAKICIAHSSTETVTISLPEFLKYDMEKKVILKIYLYALDSTKNLFKSYKITPRKQNAHAYINAGFLLEYDGPKITFARLCFGGVGKNFIQASNTEQYLQGKDLFVDANVRQAIQILVLELTLDWELPESSPEFRSKLACGLFYKFILSLAPPSTVKYEYISGGSDLSRYISCGTQVYETHKEKWPLTQPITKVEALVQCSGEAVYVNDLPYLPSQVWAAFVQARKSNVDVVLIDPSEALQIPGVVAFFSAKDIPGKNSFSPIGIFGAVEDEEVFCVKRIKYYGQPVGMIVAESFDIARIAAGRVILTYEKKHAEVVPTLKDVLSKNSAEIFRKSFETSFETTSNSEVKATKHFKGHFEMGGQYHFPMEPQTTICIPQEDGMAVYSATHFVDMVQVAIAEALNLKENSLNFEVRRLGGSYGSKLSRATHVAVACALACLKLNRPVRFILDIETMMTIIGKRNASIWDYDLGVDEKGTITKCSIYFYEDFGYTKNDDPIDFFVKPFIPNCYKSTVWKINGEGVLTDAPSHTWCRSPGSLEAIAATENMMEHIARIVNIDPVDVRLSNLADGSKMKTLLPEFVKSTKYRERKIEIEKFNKGNRWRKRGIAISVMKYIITYFGSFTATVSIYHRDGTVAISHGGIEMGQGINTKVQQVAAFTLNIPLSDISIKPMNNLNGANSFTSGGSITSESVCFAVEQACKTILGRMKPVRDQLKNPTWLDVVKKCQENQVSLIANHLYKVGDLQAYDVWGISCSETEVDLLTGNFQLNRVDILEDTGESLSPFIDIGQVEGAFMMGLGYWLTEKLVYDRQSGELLTNRTWNYKIPGAKDIPIDFRVTLLQNNPNSKGFLRSKTSGELGICLSVSTIFALRHALDSARHDAKMVQPWYHLGAPTTPENVLLAAGHSIAEYGLL